MITRAKLLLHLAHLSEEDVQALLVVAERLRAKHTAAAVPVSGPAATPSAMPSAGAVRHLERFGSLSGSVRVSGDVRSSPVDAGVWTYDAKNLGV